MAQICRGRSSAPNRVPRCCMRMRQQDPFQQLSPLSPRVCRSGLSPRDHSLWTPFTGRRHSSVGRRIATGPQRRTASGLGFCHVGGRRGANTARRRRGRRLTGGRPQSSRGDRLPAQPGRGGLDDGRAQRAFGGTAARAREPRQSPGFDRRGRPKSANWVSNRGGDWRMLHEVVHLKARRVR